MAPAVVAELLRTSMSQGQRPHLTITSGSMRPLLQIGDEVQLEAVTLLELQPGDIITVVAPEALLTHRFWGSVVEPDGSDVCLVTRGDRYLTFDAPWSQHQFIGRVIARRRRRRWSISFQKGGGKWLSRHVAYVAAAENHLFHLDWHLAGQPMGTKGRNTTLVIQVRRLIYLWITLIASFVNFVVREAKSAKQE